MRVALYVLATGVTDPDKICADLKLRSRISAESALAFWAGAGLLERYEENAALGYMFATLEEIKAFAAEDKFLHYDSIKQAFEF